MDNSSFVVGLVVGVVIGILVGILIKEHLGSGITSITRDSAGRIVGFI